MSLARLLPLLLAAGLLAAGCGSSDEHAPKATATTPVPPPAASARSCEGTVAGASDLRVTGVGCNDGWGLVAAWVANPACAPKGDASRASCAPHKGYRCLSAATDRGVAVSCARSGSSIAFVAKHG